MKATDLVLIITTAGGFAYGMMERLERILIVEQGIETTRVIAQAAEASARALLEQSCLSHHEENP